MNKQIITAFVFSVVSFVSALAQPYVVNEEIEKVFSEAFTDINDHFASTPSNDAKFWGKYADGYYYMERKIASPRAIIAKTKAVSKNFSIKTKLTLGPLGGSDASVGIMFLVKSSSRGGFVFELNKKKSFRIQDLGTSAYITKEGKDGWVKSKELSPATRSNTVEIKAFRGKFDIYVNGSYIYSFINDSYQKGNFGMYIGPNSAASLYYFNAYELDIPGAAPEVNLSNLQEKIDALQEENDSLKTLELTAKFGADNKGAIAAIKVLEKQLRAVNEENTHLKGILKEYEAEDPVYSEETIKKDQEQSDILVEKIGKLSAERDSVLEANAKINNRAFAIAYQRDSLRQVNLDLIKKMDFLEAHMKEVQAEIEGIKSISNSPRKEEPKAPSKPSEVATLPKMEIPTPATAPTMIPAMDTVDATKLVEQDSTYDHTIDIDNEISSDSDQSGGLFDEPQKVELKPLRVQKIKVEKAIKAEYKD